MKGPEDTDEWIDVGTYKDLPITAGGKIEIVPDAAMVAKVKEWALKGSHKFYVTYSAELDELPAKFETKARIHIVASVGL